MTDELWGALRGGVARYGLFTAGQTVVVGVSGGPDSTALLHALATLRDELGIVVVGAHLNHGFRGEEAIGDVEYVRGLCGRLGVECRSESVDVPAMRRRRRLSAQVAARDVRHAFLRRVADAVGAERIALGHTRNDRIETVLMNILRGTGVEGLTSLPPMSLPIIRPLIDVSRDATVAYCVRHDLQPRSDSSNAHIDYRRNRTRTELLPYLELYYNENVGDALLRLSELASADNAVLEELAASALASISTDSSDTYMFLDAGALNALPVGLRRRVIRAGIVRVRGHLQNVGFETVERLVEAVHQGRAIQIELPDPGETPVRIGFQDGQVRMVREHAPAQPVPWSLSLAFPGCTQVPHSGIEIETVLCADRAEAQSWTEQREQETLLFGRSQVTLPLVVRSWKPGDRIQPHGLNGTKKLQDLFTDKKIPVAERSRIPILVDAGGTGRVLAVYGIVVDAAAVRLRPVKPNVNVDRPRLLVAFVESDEQGAS